MEVLAEAVRRVSARERVVLVTVIRTRGSTPRKAGARMLVGAGGGGGMGGAEVLAGTVGGGRFEMEVLQRAGRLLQRRGGGFETAEIALSRALGQCCGGEMEVALETLAPPPRLFLFGAGHVARALCPAARLAGFSVTVFDDRPEFLTAERFPDAERLVDAPEPRDWPARLALDADTTCVVMTHDHGLDERIVRELLLRGAPSVGLIGSRTKAARFRARLAAWPVPPERLAAFRSPVGFPIGAATPGEIALSIAAELVAARRSAAVQTPRSCIAS